MNFRRPIDRSNLVVGLVGRADDPGAGSTNLMRNWRWRLTKNFDSNDEWSLWWI